jgi:hypothetical protein
VTLFVHRRALTLPLETDMAYDESLAKRVRNRLGKRAGLIEKKMFGGLAFLLRGNMCCGVHGDELIVRLEATETDRALKRPGVRLFDITGRPMKGWILVSPKGVSTDESLGQWIEIAVAYAKSLPPKK